MAVVARAPEISVEQPESDPLVELLTLALAALALLLPWAVLFLSVPPAEQDFPINDDWAFAKGAFDFFEGKGVHYQGWSSMPLVGQWLWAYPFIEAFGETQFTLRLATIVLSWLCLLAFYDLARGSVGLSRPVAVFATLALGLSPYFLWLSGTFMTDVPTLAFSLLALALYVRAIRSGRTGLLIAGTLVALLGAVTRQNAVVVPATAGALLLFSPKQRRQMAWWAWLALPLAVCIAAHFWLQKRADAVPRPLTWPPPSELAMFPFLLFHFLGMAVLPVLALKPWPRSWAVFLVALALMILGAIGIYLNVPDFLNPEEGLRAPYPLIWFPEAAMVHGYRPAVASVNAVRWVLTAAGCLGGAGLATRLVELLPRRWPPHPLVVFAALQVPLLLASPVLYDRYQFALLPGALFIAAAAGGAWMSRWQWAAGLATLGGIAAFAVAIEHDRLASYAAQWKLGKRALLERQIKSEDIEGGLEWDGWWSKQPASWNPTAHKGPRRVAVKGMSLPFNQMCFPELSGFYALSFAEIPGARIIDQESYAQWLPRQKRSIYLLQWQPAYNSYRRQLLGHEAR